MTYVCTRVGVSYKGGRFFGAGHSRTNSHCGMANILTLLVASAALHAIVSSTYLYDTRRNLYEGTYVTNFRGTNNHPNAPPNKKKRGPATILNWVLGLAAVRPQHSHDISCLLMSLFRNPNRGPYISYRLPGSNRPATFIATMGKREDQPQ